MTPHKNDKAKGGEDKESLKMHEELLKIEAPTMGSNDNIVNTAVQLNIAPAEPHDSDCKLIDFGGVHYDSKDNPYAYCTHMLALSDLPGEH